VNEGNCSSDHTIDRPTVCLGWGGAAILGGSGLIMTLVGYSHWHHSAQAARGD
jgi:hypothetical protein